MDKSQPWNEDNIVPFPWSDDGAKQPSRQKDQAMPSNVQCEIEKGRDHVKLIIGVGKSQIIYQLNAALAKEVGEELFKQGCNLATSQAS